MDDILLKNGETFEEFGKLKIMFLRRLNLLQNRKLSKVESSTTCLGCDKVSTVQYRFFGVIWESWVYHYILEHNGTPSKEFCKFVIERTNSIRFNTNIPMSLDESEFLNRGPSSTNNKLTIAYAVACDNMLTHRNLVISSNKFLDKVMSKGKVRGGTYRDIKNRCLADIHRNELLTTQFKLIALSLEEHMQEITELKTSPTVVMPEGKLAKFAKERR